MPAGTISLDVGNPTKIAAKAAEIRRRATLAVTRELKPMGDTDGPRADAMTLLRYLQPDQSETAIWCHQALVKEARSDLRAIGFTCEWVDLLLLLHNFLDLSGLWYDQGRWVDRATHLAELRATA